MIRKKDNKQLELRKQFPYVGTLSIDNNNGMALPAEAYKSGLSLPPTTTI